MTGLKITHILALLICTHREIYESGVTNIHFVANILEVVICF